MAPSQEAIIEALRPVEDPELHRSIVDLGMVRDVAVSDGRAKVLIALTVAGCPLKAEITSRVTSALLPLDGIEEVEVDMTVMSPEELEAIREKMGPGEAQRVVPFARSRTRVLAITSGKGGVGKSTVTVNLAVALAARGHDVGIIDADVYGFSVPQMLGVVEEPEIDNSDGPGTVIPPTAHGISCMSIGFFVEDEAPVMWRGPMLHKALEQFLVDVKWGDLEYLLVDMPPGTGDVAISLAKQLPQAETYVITTPQPAAQRVARRSGAMAREIGSTVAGVIENMSWFVDDNGNRQELFGSGGGAALADSLDTELIGQVPLITQLREGGDNGVPIMVSDPTCEVASIFDSLAARIESTGPKRVYREELKVR